MRFRQCIGNVARFELRTTTPATVSAPTTHGLQPSVFTDPCRQHLEGLPATNRRAQPARSTKVLANGSRAIAHATAPLGRARYRKHYRLEDAPQARFRGPVLLQGRRRAPRARCGGWVGGKPPPDVWRGLIIKSELLLGDSTP